jgi:hypothetical protein
LQFQFRDASSLSSYNNEKAKCLFLKHRLSAQSVVSRGQTLNKSDATLLIFAVPNVQIVDFWILIPRKTVAEQNVSEEHVASIFRADPEDAGRMYVRNVGT